MSSLLTSFGIDRCSTAERLQLVQEIWESLVPLAEQDPLTEADCRELDRRLASLDANPSNVVPWEDVEARAKKRFHGMN